MKQTVVLLFLLWGFSEAIRPPKILHDEQNLAAGEALILTPYIEQNRTEEGRNLSRVTDEVFLGVNSYSGYFTVDPRFNSNLFFWYFPSEGNPDTDPVLLWLEGGPGTESEVALFYTNGPFIVTNSNTTVELREYRWNQKANVIYIDNPVGTGFSFTTNGYAQNQTKVGEDLYSALYQFFQLFPTLADNEFYISGESYAGKYIPALGYTILQRNKDASLQINLQGVAIGNGQVDPVRQYVYSEYLYQAGLIDFNERDEILRRELAVVDLITKEEYREAEDAVLEMMGLINQYTGVNIFNYLQDVQPSYFYFREFLLSSRVRDAIHVGNTTFGDDNVYLNLYEDDPKNVTFWLSEVIANYRVLIYVGQTDISLAYPQTVSYLRVLDFPSSAEYQTAPRHKYYVNGTLAGYWKQAGNLTEVLIREAGHVVPADQPFWAYDMINRFIYNQTFPL